MTTKEKRLGKASRGGNSVTFPTRQKAVFGQSIRLRLIGSYILLIMFLVTVGVLAYLVAYRAMIKSYEKSSSETLDMIGEYLEYGFDSIKTTATEYLVDSKLTDYLSGRYDENTNEYREFYNKQKDALVTRASSDRFINGIYFFSDQVYSVSTSKTSQLNVYTEYTSGESGSAIKENPNGYLWQGISTVIDEKLNIDENSYAVRLVKAFYGQDAFLAIDVDKQAVLEILGKLETENGYMAFITSDGAELNQDGTSDTRLSQTDFYLSAVASNNHRQYHRHYHRRTDFLPD